MPRRFFLLAGSLFHTACTMLKTKGVGDAFGPSVSTSGPIATLILITEPYTPSMQAPPKEYKYSLRLLLTPSDGSAKQRLIVIARDREQTVFSKARIIGQDGNLLWFVGDGLSAFDFQSDKIIPFQALRQSNAELEDLWYGAAYDIHKHHLRVLSNDGRRAFLIDPVTLRASATAELARAAEPSVLPRAYLASGMIVAPTEWLGIHSAAEVSRWFNPGRWVPAGDQPEDFKAMRRFYRGRLDTSIGTARIGGMEAITTDEYLSGGLLRAAPGVGLIRLTSPAGFLLIYKSESFRGTWQFARIDDSGKRLWNADTGIDTLSQILPGIFLRGLHRQATGWRWNRIVEAKNVLDSDQFRGNLGQYSVVYQRLIYGDQHCGPNTCSS